MADEIRQQLTFDAQQAITELNSLNKSLQATRTILNNFGRSLGNFNRNAAGVTTTISNISRAAGNLQQSVSGGLIPAQATSNIQRSTTLVDGFGNSLNKSATASQSASRSAGQAATTIQNTGQAASRAQPGVRGLTVSFGTMARIITTQLTVRAFAGFTQGLRNATASAIDFQLRVAQIRSIADGTFESFDEVAGAVRRVSDAFNQPLGEVQEGLYQIISNQIRGAAEQIAVLESSSQLAKIGVANLSDTVDLLTGTINAFQLDAQDANQISAVFFETVRLGRTRISQLAKSFGTIAPLAAEAGVSFEELAGAFATITVNGVDTTKAATQLRGIINAFIKPTKELDQILRDAGFSSGELAIQTLGLGGALDLLQDATGGSTTELARLIPRVRGLSGALVLARNEGRTLRNTVEELRTASQDLLRDRLDIRLETNAEQVTSDLNRIRNALTVDLGQAILAQINNFLQFTQASDVLITTIQVLGPTFITVGTAAGIAALAVGGYTAATRIATVANGLFAVSSKAVAVALFGVSRNAVLASRAIHGFGLALGVAFAALVGVQIGLSISDAIDSSIAASLERNRQRIANELIKGERGQALEQSRRETREEVRGLEERGRALQKYLNTIRQSQANREQIFFDANDAILDDTLNLFDALEGANRNLLNNLEQERERAAQSAQDAVGRAGGIRDTLSDNNFRQGIRNINERAQAFSLEQRAADLAAQANRDLASARTEEDRRAAQNQLQRAEGFLREAEAIGESSNNLALQNRFFRTRQSISQQTLRSEQEFARLQGQVAAEAEARLQQEQQRVLELNREIGQAREAIREFQSADNESATERLRLLEEARRQISDITPELAFGDIQKTSFSDLVSLETFRSDLENEIRQADLQSSLEDVFGATKLDSISDAFRRATTEGTLKAVQELNEQNLTFSLDLQLSGSEQIQSLIDQAAQGFQEQITERQRLFQVEERGVSRAIAGQSAIKAAQEENLGIIRRIAEILGDSMTLLSIDTGSPRIEQFRQGLEELERQATNIGKNLENITPESAEADINRLKGLFGELQDTATIAEEAALATINERVRILLNELEKANQVGVDPARQASADIADNIATLPQSGAQFQSAMAGAEGNAGRAAAAMKEAAAAAAAATPRHFGGMIHRQHGGLIPKLKRYQAGNFAPFGTDTTLAALTPGERVTDAINSRRFFSELQAIGAGVRPTQRQEGGVVNNNTNVGDINVNVEGNRIPEKTGREIASSLRRELRRRTSVL